MPAARPQEPPLEPLSRLPHRPRPLLVCADERLLDDLLRLAAAAGVEVDVANDGPSARPRWSAAPLVLVGADVVDSLAAAPLPRRPDLAVVATDLDDPSVWQRAVAIGAAEVAFLPDAEAWLVDALADSSVHGPEAVVVGVVGGRGGAGASSLAAALALAGLRHGLRTVLVDGDPLGGGLDLVLGGEDVPGLRWPDLAGARGRVAPSDLVGALPSMESLLVLSWDRGDMLDVDPEAMDSVLRAAAQGTELVIVDLPRRPDAPTRVALGRADRTFLVVPAEVRAVTAAGRVAALVGPVTASLQLVVRGPAPGGLDAEVVAQALGLPLAGHCRPEPGLALALERGLPPGGRRGPLADLAGQLVGDVVSGARPGPTRASR